MWMFVLLACSGEPEKADRDGDGYIDDDCDDGDAAVHPGAAEACDGADQDCDGEIDEGVKQSFYVDSDGDGIGAAETGACVASAGLVEAGGDCDDEDPAILPGAAEECDGIDEDCDGDVDDNPVDGVSYWVDADADGFGDETGTSVTACEGSPIPSGYAEAGDCDDTDAAVSPAATEICDDRIDQNCDGGATPCDLTGDVVVEDAPTRVDGAGIAGFGTAVMPMSDFDGSGDKMVLAIGAPDEDMVYMSGVPLRTTAPSPSTPEPGTLDALRAWTLSGSGRPGSGGPGSLLADGGCAEPLSAGTCFNTQIFISGTDAERVWVLQSADGEVSRGFDELAALTVVAGSVLNLAGGDLNGDGIGDLIVRAGGVVTTGAESIDIVWGPFESSVVTPLVADVSLQSGLRTACGEGLASGRTALGPDDDEGYQELLVGCPGEDSGDGAVWFIGGESLVTASGSPTIASVARTEISGLAGQGAGIGSAVAFATMYTGADLLVGAPTYDGTAGAVFVFNGELRGGVDVVSANLTLVGENGSYFGAQLSSGTFLGQADESFGAGSGTHSLPGGEAWLVHTLAASRASPEAAVGALEVAARSRIVPAATTTLGVLHVDDVSRSLILTDPSQGQVWLWPARGL